MKFSALRTAVASLAIAFFASSYSLSQLPSHNVPRAVSLTKDLGHVNPSNQVNLTVVLQPHNEAEYDKAVDALYDPASPTFHQWFTDSDFEKYAPTQEEFDSVKRELINQGFTVISSDSNRFSIRVHGTVGNAESAFQTEIHSFQLKNGRIFQAHTRDAVLTGPAAPLVKAVAGLERHQAQPQLVYQKNYKTGQPRFKKTLVSVKDSGGILSQISELPLSASETFNYTTPGASLPTATYTGTVYDQNSNLIVSYTPTDLQTHYGLIPLIEEGFDGSGQTIALVEAFGYAAAETDANAFSTLFGLPALTSKNFQVIYPEGKPLNPNAADLTGWTTEIALDIQTAHSIAPGAKILVVASAGQDNEDQIASLQYIISKKLANTVSSSWENDDEIIAGPAELDAFNSVLKKGAAAGISFQFSSGDGGDLGLGTPVGAVEVPSDSPYAVAVGGTSILNNPIGLGDIVTGWGNNAAYVALGGALDPPFALGFLGGAGGGQSQFFAKPSWQTGVPGKWRQVPDVSALADPNTGVVVVVTSQGTQFVEAGIGGTSLASPLFTALWAIGDQINGKPLGFASPTIAKLKAGQITDVLPTNSIIGNNPAGSVTDSSGTTDYSAADLFTGLLYSQTQFTSGLLPFDSSDAAVLSFGTDSSLTVTKGWDNVTGYGEPNGLPFYFAILDNEKAKSAVKKVQARIEK
ncbi:S53 family peptidase [Terracidiphilus gabretensis]|uniref:S53 family peptidase n=1 Tax=Terracidiphilus gabretensis TaxID=1577687 RepID=UPI00071C00EE|nr:S53 family peptidase [Terracidiphilus gabretensis]